MYHDHPVEHQSWPSKSDLSFSKDLDSCKEWIGQYSIAGGGGAEAGLDGLW